MDSKVSLKQNEDGKWVDEQGNEFVVLQDEGDNMMDDSEGEDDNLEEELDEDDDMNEIEDDAIAILTVHNDPVYCVSLVETKVSETETKTMAITGGGDDVAYICDMSTLFSDAIANAKNEMEMDEKLEAGEEDEDFSDEGKATATSTTIFDDTKYYTKLEGHTDTVIDVDMNFNKTLVATASMDGTVRIYNMATKQTSVLSGPTAALEWVKWHPKGNVIVAGGEDCMLWMWMAISAPPSSNSNAKDKHKLLNVFSSHSDSITCGSFSPDGKLLLSGSLDGSVRVWNPKTAACEHNLSGPKYNTDGIVCLAFPKQEATSVVGFGSLDGSVCLANFKTGKFIAKLQGHDSSVEAIDFCATLPCVVSGSLDNTIRIWDINTKQTRDILAHDAGVIKVKCHATEPYIYSASEDLSIRVWDSRSSECVASLTGHSKLILDFDVSADGRTIITGSDDNTARIFKW